MHIAVENKRRWKTYLLGFVWMFLLYFICILFISIVDKSINESKPINHPRIGIQKSKTRIVICRLWFISFIILSTIRNHHHEVMENEAYTTIRSNRLNSILIHDNFKSKQKVRSMCENEFFFHSYFLLFFFLVAAVHSLID